MTKKNEKKAKTIILTNGQLEAMAFNPAFRKAVQQPFPVKTSYWLARAMEKIERELKPFMKTMNEIMEKYAEKRLNDKTKKEEIKRRPDGMPVWGKNEEIATAALEELRAIEVDLGIQPIKLDLEACEKMDIIPSPETFALLMPLLEEL